MEGVNNNDDPVDLLCSAFMHLTVDEKKKCTTCGSTLHLTDQCKSSFSVLKSRVINSFKKQKKRSERSFVQNAETYFTEVLSLVTFNSSTHFQLKCPCWTSTEFPYCRLTCEYKLSPYLRTCGCGYNSSCADCLTHLECKLAVLNCLQIRCLCLNGESEASRCSKCRIKVIKTLATARYPTCSCKDIYSTDLNRCRPFCKTRLNDVYDNLFPAGVTRPELRVWRTKDIKPVLPACECWTKEKMVCSLSCKNQISTKLRILYQENCPCNQKNSIYQVCDAYCWLMRCFKCAPRK